jgi:predicted ATPase
MQDNRFSLTRVSLWNYKNLARVDVEPGGLLILVGPNGSGKSNFLDALSLVAEGLRTSLDQALRIRGGTAEVSRRFPGRRRPMNVRIELGFTAGDLTGDYGVEVAATGGGGFRIAHEYCNVRDADHDTNRAWFDVRNGELADQSEPVMPPVDDQRLYLVSAAGIDDFRAVFEGLSGISVFNIVPGSMREPRTPDSGAFLLPDGSNLASVLHRMAPSARERMTEYLAGIVPGLLGVSRKDLGTWETLEFLQDAHASDGPQRFPAQSMSDGTLRALGVLVALFSDTGRTRSTIGIEEPENALHPAASGVLLDALRDAAERRQVIITSHSPDLLDRDDLLPEELCAVRSMGAQVRIGPLDAAGTMALREHLYTPGELLRTDQLLPALEEPSTVRGED